MKIGEILVERGTITREQLEAALQESRKTGEVIGQALVRLKFIGKDTFMEILAEQLGIVFYPQLRDIEVSAQVISLVPAKYVWHYKFMPLAITGNTLKIAVSDPLALWQVENLKLYLGYDIERVMASEEEILEAIRKYYGVGAETIEDIIQKDSSVVSKPVKGGTDDLELIEKSVQDASVIKLVNQILTEAIDSRATDIHIEVVRDRVEVRYRIDGILYKMRFPDEIKYLHQAIIARIKIMSSLNIVERRLPQDGRAVVKLHDRQVDLRISIIPVAHGENAVIRILPVQLLFSLEDLGFLSADLTLLEKLIIQPHGIIFLTGPTGSGKTTTLYACLSRLNRESRKIITIEDPVEYELEGIMQIQVRPEINFSFANALRSILRHDPDVMMVGEVRDLETAELAIRTALTGHLIFSTLHTNDACSGATRLIDIGIEPYLVTASVNAFISQRLVRTICPSCKEKRTDTTGLPACFQGFTTYMGTGCDMCKKIGYRGMTAVYEILLVDDEIKEMIIKKDSVSQIRRSAIERGFRPMLAAGIEKVRLGVTTPEEVMKVTEAV
jgi:type II secretory ATPase GspE/PulE/Tfp pilus assembly ATPase PilB-like protein